MSDQYSHTSNVARTLLRGEDFNTTYCVQVFKKSAILHERIGKDLSPQTWDMIGTDSPFSARAEVEIFEVGERFLYSFYFTDFGPDEWRCGRQT